MLVVAGKLGDARGKVIDSVGFYIVRTEFDAAGNAQMDSAVADFAAHRLTSSRPRDADDDLYDISTDRAFEILVWRSQQTT